MRIAKVCVVLLAPVLCAQWTVEDAVRRAGTSYPEVGVSMEQAALAASALMQAQLSYRMRGEAMAQVNRATRNNVFGMLLPNGVVAPISGPPLATNAGTNVWGSATGIALSWEPFDLGQRAARVDAAKQGMERAERAIARTRFEVESAAADAFLTALAAEEMEVSAKAAIERARTFKDVVKALVDAELRPGADLARAEAEFAMAQSQAVQVRQAIEQARASLAKFAGEEAMQVRLSSGGMQAPLAAPGAAGTPQEHPLVAEQKAAIAAADASVRAAELLWRPRFFLNSSLYARGTGAQPDGTTLAGLNGLGPNIYNWGLGFTVSFPFLDRPHAQAQQYVEIHRRALETERLKQINLDLRERRSKAESALKAARQIEAILPAQLTAAQAAEKQAKARYQAGLATALEVADAQRLLAQAETDTALARLAVWRAQLAVEIARGDLAPFLAMAR